MLATPGRRLKPDELPDDSQDFSQVRLHTDPDAAASAQRIGAQAYTLGSHIVFGPGRYLPGTRATRTLLAHELGHVGPPTGRADRLVVGDAHDPAETRADRGIPTADPPGFAVVRRQTRPPDAADAVADPATLTDPVGFHPGWVWRLIPGDYDRPPTFQETQEQLQRIKPELIPLLLDATATEYRPPRGDRYWAFRHPTAGVIARAMSRWSGTRGIGREERQTYGVYLYLTEAEGDRLFPIAPPQPAGAGTSSGQGQPTGPVDPLLDIYFQHFPSTPGGTPTRVLSPEMRLRLALSLADRGLFGSIYDAAMDAITNPLFIAQTILMIGVYVGLWLTPDPTLLTKVLAAGLTAYLLTMFAWSDIIGFGRAWFALESGSRAANSEEELRQAGNAFMRKLGQVGFDVFVMVLFWGAGRAVRAPLRAARGRIITQAREAATAEVTRAAEAPRSGAPEPRATPAELDALTAARDAAGPSATPTQILDEFAQRLPQGAREGLRAERANPAGDARVLTTLDARARAGTNLFRWLEGRGLTADQVRTAQQNLVDAQARLARARAIELGSLNDFPGGRPSIRADLRNAIADFGRLLRRSSPRFAREIQQAQVQAVAGDLGEALARGQLTRALPPGVNVPAGATPEVVSSLEIARRVPGFRTVAEWARAQGVSGRAVAKMRQGPDGVYESLGQIDNGVGYRTPNGRLRLVAIEETKTGGETGASAREQVTSARDILNEINNGTSPARIMERRTSTTVGSDLTGGFDLGEGANIRALTRGPEGRTGFDASLGFGPEDLTAAARQLISEGVPTGEPGPARQVTTSGPGRRDEQR